ncbi:hypothetical protein PGT21_019504 [Puccinia graminis f. sp. tritici]|uniref:Uncharacterized protein n=1 Tax=Puccinia graminis f. sp. tritici TaxID=56615 RepID=A0A5B0RKC6_PUCGR|nr:hypothetical protein PGT21_019504 [Puccinia graminis f. sp. tritici]KAA1125869.1 hypothetical protein PGTUg99_011858 [Puccinia graminis f. sp. tritici]
MLAQNGLKLSVTQRLVANDRCHLAIKKNNFLPNVAVAVTATKAELQSSFSVAAQGFAKLHSYNTKCIVIVGVLVMTLYDHGIFGSMNDCVDYL